MSDIGKRILVASSSVDYNEQWGGTLEWNDSATELSLFFSMLSDLETSETDIPFNDLTLSISFHLGVDQAPLVCADDIVIFFCESKILVLEQVYPEDIYEDLAKNYEAAYESAELPRLPCETKIYVRESELEKLEQLARTLNEIVESSWEKISFEKSDLATQSPTPEVATSDQSPKKERWRLGRNYLTLVAAPFFVRFEGHSIHVHEGGLFRERFDWTGGEKEKIELLARICTPDDLEFLDSQGYSATANAVLNKIASSQC